MLEYTFKMVMSFNFHSLMSVVYDCIILFPTLSDTIVMHLGAKLSLLV